MIHLDNVCFAYAQSTFRLSVPEFRMSRGEKVALTGPSGSGKTTLLNLIAGVLAPDSGKIVTSGTALESLRDRDRREFRIQNIGLVFQEFELLEHLSVLDNILLPCRITSSLHLEQHHRQRAAQLAQDTGLADKLSRFVRKLSQGERQRVALCRALLLTPPLLLCDEPTGNLDPSNKQHVMDLLLEQVLQSNTTLLTVTHDQELLPYFDRTLNISSFYDQQETSSPQPERSKPEAAANSLGRKVRDP